MTGEYEIEHAPGLPGKLPPGERMLWQGAPERRLLVRSAFHARKVAVYFGVLIAAGIIAGTSATGIALTVAACLAAVGLLEMLAWATARATLYTITDKRVVLRIGVAIQKCINLPLAEIAAADFRDLGGGAGEISLTLKSPSPFGYVLLWPHARGWRLAKPEPMLRALPDGEKVANLLARACGAPAQVELASVPVVEALAA